MNRFAWLGFFGASIIAAFCLCSCTPKKVEELSKPPRTVGVVMAELAMQAAGANKNITILAPDARWGGTSELESSLRSTLQSKGYAISTINSYMGDPMHGVGVGLQGADFFAAMQNAAKAGAVVSVSGPPLVMPADAAQLPAGHPPILVIAVASFGEQLGLPGSRGKVQSLLDAKIIQLAIVDGADDSGTNSAAKTDATHALFAENYRILRQAQ